MDEMTIRENKRRLLIELREVDDFYNQNFTKDEFLELYEEWKRSSSMVMKAYAVELVNKRKLLNFNIAKGN